MNLTLVRAFQMRMAYDDPSEFEFTLGVVQGMRAHPIVDGLCVMPHGDAITFAAVREILLGAWN